MNVVLIGYRATGKTSTGRILADRLKTDFYDSDAVVEHSAGMPVKTIVATKGWAFFREMEKATVKRLAKKKNCVMATGGGVVLFRENIDILKKTGVIIWLNTPMKDIIERLRQDARHDGVRPPFTAGDLAEETREVMEQRLPLYRAAADYTVNTKGKNQHQLAEEIYRYLLKTGKFGK